MLILFCLFRSLYQHKFSCLEKKQRNVQILIAVASCTPSLTRADISFIWLCTPSLLWASSNLMLFCLNTNRMEVYTFCWNRAHYKRWCPTIDCIYKVIENHKLLPRKTDFEDHTQLWLLDKHRWSWLDIHEHHKFSPLIWDLTEWLVFQQYMLHIIISQRKLSLIENFFQQYMLHISISGHKLAWYRRVNFYIPSKAAIKSWNWLRFVHCLLANTLPLCLGKFKSLLIAVIIHIWKLLSKKKP